MPWVSKGLLQMLRAQYEAEIHDLRRDVEWLRTALAESYRHHRSLERVAQGLPEKEPPAPQPKKPPEQIPSGVMRLVELHPQSVRIDLIDSIRAARQEKPPVSWELISNEIRGRMPAELLKRLDEGPA